MTFLQTLPHHVKPSETEGLVTISIELPSDLVNPVLLAFSSMTDLVRGINSKVKIASSAYRKQEMEKQGAIYYEKLSSAIFETFDALIAEKVFPHDALKKTNIAVKVLFPGCTFDIVKKILTKSGRLKKNGFYKK